MSWYKDPQLLIRHAEGDKFYIIRSKKRLNIGLVITQIGDDRRGSVSREDPNSPFYNLPGITACFGEQDQQKPQQVLALEKKISDLETTLKDKETKWTSDINSRRKEVSELQQKLELEKKDKLALQNQISELTSKLEETCVVGSGSTDDEPWLTGHPVPSNWLSFDDLDVHEFPKDNHLNICKVMGASKFGEDNTTNVHSSRFYRGLFPIVVVNVPELTPNHGDARFDPEFWSLYNNEGTSYAARKPFASEMLDDKHKTG
ncbi:hypothetical protein MKW94_011047 [Papaver nudicaule]|uniref:Uncharacterized protein n=1 Tax=Papaver nudicaule TaxID=74823 RepID=A0AA41S6X7_PAPNU|nr:hypothetical protein [Papaver nudicaule]